MAAARLVNSFEGGTNGTTLLTSNTGGASGNAFDFVNAAGTLIFDNTHVMHGALALKVATVASAAPYAQWKASLGTQGQVWFRTYLYFTANPSAQHKVLGFAPTAGGANGSVWVSTTGHLLFTDSAAVTQLTSTNAIPLNAWFRIEGFIIPSTTVGQVSLSVWSTTPDSAGPADTAQTSAATLNTNANVGIMDIGNDAGAANVGPYWQDDPGILTTGPLGPSVPVRTAPSIRSLPARPARRRDAGRSRGGMLPGVAAVVPPIVIRRRSGTQREQRLARATQNRLLQSPQVPPIVIRRRSGTQREQRLVRAPQNRLIAGMLPGKGLSGIPPAPLALARRPKLPLRQRGTITGPLAPGFVAAVIPVRPVVLTAPRRGPPLLPRPASRLITGMMPRDVLLVNPFESGSNGVTVSTANSGGAGGSAFDLVVIGTGASDTFDNSNPAHGALANTVSTGGTSASVYNSWLSSQGSHRQVWFRAYLRFTAVPAANTRVIQFVSGGAAAGGVSVFSTGAVAVVDATGAAQQTTTTLIPLNAWFRVEGFIIGDPAAGQLELKLFTTADSVSPIEWKTSAATLNTRGLIDGSRYGICVSLANAGPFGIDDIGLSSTGYLGPVAVQPVTSLIQPKQARLVRLPRPAPGRILTGMLPGQGLSGIPPVPVLRARPPRVIPVRSRLITGMLPGQGLSGIPVPFTRARAVRALLAGHSRIAGPLAPAVAAAVTPLGCAVLRPRQAPAVPPRARSRVVAGAPGALTIPVPVPVVLRPRQAPPLLPRARIRAVRGILLAAAVPVTAPVLRSRPVLLAGRARSRIIAGLPGAITVPVPVPAVLRPRQAPLTPTRARNRIIAGAPGALSVPVPVPVVLRHRQKIRPVPQRLVTSQFTPTFVVYPVVAQQARLRPVTYRLARRPAGTLRTGMLPGKGLFGIPPVPVLRIREAPLVRRPVGRLVTGMLPGQGLSGLPPTSFLRSRPARAQRQPGQRIATGTAPPIRAVPIVQPARIRWRLPVSRLLIVVPPQAFVPPVMPQQARLRAEPARLVRAPAQRLARGFIPPPSYPVLAQQARLRAEPSRLARRPAGRLATGMLPGIPAALPIGPPLTAVFTAAGPSAEFESVTPEASGTLGSVNDLYPLTYGPMYGTAGPQVNAGFEAAGQEAQMKDADPRGGLSRGGPDSA